MSIKGFEVGGVQQQYDYTALDNIPANLVQDANYVHTDNNYTNADKTKLSGIEAQANKTTIDATLTHSGQAADAKATGDEIGDLKSALLSGAEEDAIWHLGFYLDENGDLCQVEEETNNG